MSALEDRLREAADRQHAHAEELKKERELKNQLLIKGVELLIKGVDLAVGELDVEAVDLDEAWTKVKEWL